MYQVLWRRSIENEKERLITILVAPFMSCSARLPVYALFVGAFFSAHQSLVVLSLYILGIVVALLVSTLLNKLILKDNQSVLLWSYRHTVFHHLKHFGAVLGKSKGFVKKQVPLFLVVQSLFGHSHTSVRTVLMSRLIKVLCI